MDKTSQIIKFDVNKVFIKIFDSIYQNFLNYYEFLINTPTAFEIELENLLKISTNKHIQKAVAIFNKYKSELIMKKKFKEIKYLPKGIVAFVNVFEKFLNKINQKLTEKNLTGTLTTQEQLNRVCNEVIDLYKEEISETLNQKLLDQLNNEFYTPLIFLDQTLANTIKIQNHHFWQIKKANIIKLFASAFTLLTDFKYYENFVIPNKDPQNYTKRDEISIKYLELCFITQMICPFIEIICKNKKTSFNKYDYLDTLIYPFFFIDEDFLSMSEMYKKLSEKDNELFESFLDLVSHHNLSNDEVSTAINLLDDNFENYEKEVHQNNISYFDIKFYINTIIQQNSFIYAQENNDPALLNLLFLKLDKAFHLYYKIEMNVRVKRVKTREKIINCLKEMITILLNLYKETFSYNLTQWFLQQPMNLINFANKKHFTDLLTAHFKNQVQKLLKKVKKIGFSNNELIKIINFFKELVKVNDGFNVKDMNKMNDLFWEIDWEIYFPQVFENGYDQKVEDLFAQKTKKGSERLDNLYFFINVLRIILTYNIYYVLTIVYQSNSDWNVETIKFLFFESLSKKQKH